MSMLPFDTHRRLELRQHVRASHNCPASMFCMICDGGLFLCGVCGGAEGSLPSECPGERMTTAQEEAVYAGRLDFRQGAWRAL